MVQASRKARGQSDSTVWGTLTDGHWFYFFRLSNEGKWPAVACQVSRDDWGSSPISWHIWCYRGTRLQRLRYGQVSSFDQTSFQTMGCIFPLTYLIVFFYYYNMARGCAADATARRGGRGSRAGIRTYRPLICFNQSICKAIGPITSGAKLPSYQHSGRYIPIVRQSIITSRELK